MASVLQYHKNNAGIIQELNKCLLLKKKGENISINKKHYRCLLHSKKPIPNS